MQRKLSATFDLVELHKIQVIKAPATLRDFPLFRSMHVAPGGDRTWSAVLKEDLGKKKKRIKKER